MATRSGRAQSHLEDFKAGRVRVLVARDVATRGLDIAHLSLVVSSICRSLQDYVHRVGRTGRAGQHGRAVSLMSRSETGLLRQIQRVVVARLKRVAVPGIAETGTRRVSESAPARKESRLRRRRRRTKTAARAPQYAAAHGQPRDGRRRISVARLSGV